MTGQLKRIVFDATPIQPKMKGLGLFLRSLLDEFEKHQPSWLDRVYVDESYVEEAKDRWPNLPTISVKASPAILWEQWQLPRLVGRSRDIILFTARDRVAHSLASRTVMYLFEIPDYRFKIGIRHGLGLYGRLSGAYNLWNFRHVVQDLHGLIVGSQSTLKDVVEKYKVSPEIPLVVYASISDRFKEEVSDQVREDARKTLTGGKPYVLHFATGDPRDNSMVALQAFAKACDDIPQGVILFVVGTNAEVRAEIQREAEPLGLISKIVIAPYLTDEQLIAAYRGASAYLDPTLYEGFGMQLIEAMACGVPVLSSRITSVPEIVRDAGLLFNPQDTSGFANGLSSIFNDAKLKDSLIQRGKKRAQLFTWKETARHVSEILNGCATGG